MPKLFLMSSTSVPKGTRDFLPDQMSGRKFLLNLLEELFQRHAFLPIETPSMEKIDTLLGKYGEEGDRLIFKVLNRGDRLSRALSSICSQSDIAVKETNSLADAALRYDLTIPFARFISQHRNDLHFPFKRYQIQPVWRADRPQKGRYREFVQCDVDIIGSSSILNELELIQITGEAFSSLGLSDVIVKINHRKLLEGIVTETGTNVPFQKITIVLDKWEKIGLEAVKNELSQAGMKEKEIEVLIRYVHQNTSINSIQTLPSNQMIEAGCSELEQILDWADKYCKVKVELDLKLARGLDYYTGIIIEAIHPEFGSSILGGGRYDNLTGMFGLPGVSGVGISFGADRIYDLLSLKRLLPESPFNRKSVLILNLGAEPEWMIRAASLIRESDAVADIYPDESKLKKQMKFANDKGFDFVVFMGAKERSEGTLKIRNMQSGDELELKSDELSTFFKK